MNEEKKQRTKLKNYKYPGDPCHWLNHNCDNYICNNCDNCTGCKNCKNCKNCVNCIDCEGCVGLKNKVGVRKK